jgi:hypothetical protein
VILKVAVGEFKGIILARSVSKLPDRLLLRFRDPHIKHSSVETRFLAWFHACIATANRVRTLLIAQTIVFLAECLWPNPIRGFSGIVENGQRALGGPGWGDLKNRLHRCYTVFFRVLERH